MSNEKSKESNIIEINENDAITPGMNAGEKGKGSSSILMLLVSVNASVALFMFLLTYWLFFSYGATDLALTPPNDDLLPVLLLSPFLATPIFILAIKHLKPHGIQITRLVLVVVVCAVHVVHLTIVWMHPVFASRWTWQYNDLRELHYLVPYLKTVASIGSFWLFLLFFQDLMRMRSGPDQQQRNVNDEVAGLVIILLGVFGFGMFQELCVMQPLWVSLVILGWSGVCSSFLVFLAQIYQWKRMLNSHGKEDRHQESAGKQDYPKIKQLPVKDRVRNRSTRFGIIFGITLWCVFVSYHPAQLVFQEGPTNAWGHGVFVGCAIAILFLLIWKYCRLSPIQSFFTVVAMSSISPIVLMIGWSTIPGIVPIASRISLIGPAITLAWMLFHGLKKLKWWTSLLTLTCIWIWCVGFVIFFHDPLLEFWELEEGFLEMQISFGLMPDPLGTGVGLGYAFIFYVSLLGLAISSILLITEMIKKRKPTKSTISRPSASTKPEHSISPSTPRARGKTKATITVSTRRQLKASLVGFLAVFGSTLVFTHLNTSKNSPVVVAEMANHGVLWLANSHDRVLPNYHPSFRYCPRNSTISVHAMIGEVEMIQLVFSPVASKMISFQGYRWTSPGGTIGDHLWKEEHGTLVNIPIRTGRVGYINCFDSNIADVLLPWSSFITGSATRENIPFWMEIEVPRNVSAGKYTTSFEYITTSYLQRMPRETSLRFTIQLTVWNITRPLKRNMDTCIGLHPENPQLTDELYKLAIKYGADPYSIASPSVTYDPSNLSAGLSINWTTFDARVQQMLELGMNHIKLDFYPGIDCRHDANSVIDGSKDNYLTLIKWFYGNASIHLASKTTPWGTTWESETITQHSDEPDPKVNPNTLQAFDILYKIIRNVSRIRSFQTFKYEPEFDEWLDCLDIWVLTPDSFSEQVANKIRAAGHEVWTYSNGDNFPGTDTDLRTPLIMSRLRGWVDYHYNISGFLHWNFYWNYNDAGRSGCGYDGRGDGTEIVPYNNSYVPTLRLAAFRDGLEDNDLLWMLNRTIALARERNISSPILNEAISILNEVDKALNKQLPD
ncbi:MAG: glycoside hydrolase domain-containing protein, partial [Promethearchaeota archaeon]